jgi:hypothetical protein
MQASDVPDDEGGDEAIGLTIEIPLDRFNPEKLDNLTKMVNAKTPLLKAALGIDELPIQISENTIKFPWFNGNLDGEHTNAYTTLISLMCKTAREKKRITAKEKEMGGSPKYEMRCFLLSIGFIGAEYKAARKILLSKLEGNSSWGSTEAYEAMQERRRKGTTATDEASVSETSVETAEDNETESEATVND